MFKVARQVGLFSGGKDSLVACLESGVKEVIYCNTGIGINFEYVLRMCEKLKWKLHVLHPAKNHTFEDFVKKFSFPHPFLHGAVMRYLKTNPIQKWNREQEEDIIFISGRRKSESKRRQKMEMKQREKRDGLEFYSPIFNWTTKDVYDYIETNQLELSPIYKTMHMSGDCFCGAFSRRGETFLLKIFHKDLAKRLEDLEKKYGGHWGNHTKISESQDNTLDDFVCQECKND